MKKICKKVLGATLIAVLLASFNMSLAVSQTDINNQKSQQQENNNKIKETEQKKEEVKEIKDETLKEVEQLNSQITDYQGQITSLDSKYTDEIIENLSDITIIDNETLYFIGTTIESEIGIYNNGMEDYSITLDVLKELGLKNNFLTRKIDTLSFTEKIYLNILRRLSGTSKRVLFKDMYRYLDYRNQKNFKNLLNYLKEKKYIIIVTGSDADNLYKVSDYSIIWYKGIFVYDTTDNVYTSEEVLTNKNINVPALPLITYKAKEEKNVKLFYSKDVRDIIKDIYKHV